MPYFDHQVLYLSMVDQEGHFKKISFDPSQAQVDQEVHPD